MTQDKTKAGTNPDWLVENENGSKTITLPRPATLAGALVGHVTMREPLVSDQLAGDKVKGSAADQEIAILANLCEVAPAELHALGLRAYKRLQSAYMSFVD